MVSIESKLILGDEGYAWRASPSMPWDSRDLVRYSLLRVLESAVRNNLHLANVVAAFAMEQRGFVTGEVISLAKQLELGVPLATAMEQTPLLFHPSHCIAVRFGEQTDCLPAVLSHLISGDFNRLRSFNNGRQASRFYWLMMSFQIFVVTNGIIFFIFPTLKKMMNEFDMSRPSFFQFADDFFSFIGSYSTVFFLAFLFTWTWILSPYFSHKLKRGIPFIRHIDFSRGNTAMLYDLIALSIQRSLPLTKTLSVLAKYFPEPHLRRKLAVARNDMELGAPVWNALAASNVILRNHQIALEALKEPSAQSYMLSDLATRIRINGETTTLMSRLLVGPIVTLMFAMIVLLLALAMFSVLVNLTLSLS